MSLSSTTTRVSFAGNGSTTIFPVPFYFLTAANLKVISINNVSGVATVKALTTDYTVSGTYVGIGIEDDYTNGGAVTMIIAPPATESLLIYRDVAMLQDLDLGDNDRLPAEEVEKRFDKAMMIDQRLSARLDRAVVLPETFVGTFDTTIPKIPAYPATLRTNDTQTAWQWVPLEESGTTGSVPTGGGVGAALVKTTANDFEMEWSDLVFDGISALTGAQFTAAGLPDVLNKIIRITYTPPQMSFTASGSGTLRERGNAVTASTLQAITTKKSDPIAAVRFYQGATLLDTVAVPNPAGGTDSYSWTGSFSTNTTFSAQVDDNGATGGPTTVTGSATFSFVYPYYYGAGAVGLTAAQVALLTKDIRSSSTSVAPTMVATVGQVFYFAYPASYGALTSILDVNGFETLPDWTMSTQNITGLDASAQSYRIYAFNNPVAAGSYYYNFKR